MISDSVLSTSVMGFPKKLDRGVDGWGELYPVFFLGYLDFFNFAKPLHRKASSQTVIKSKSFMCRPTKNGCILKVELLNEDLQDQLDCNNVALGEVQAITRTNKQLSVSMGSIKIRSNGGKRCDIHPNCHIKFSGTLCSDGYC